MVVGAGETQVRKFWALSFCWRANGSVTGLDFYTLMPVRSMDLEKDLGEVRLDSN